MKLEETESFVKSLQTLPEASIQQRNVAAVPLTLLEPLVYLKKKGCEFKSSYSSQLTAPPVMNQLNLGTAPKKPKPSTTACVRLQLTQGHIMILEGA